MTRFQRSPSLLLMMVTCPHAVHPGTGVGRGDYNARRVRQRD